MEHSILASHYGLENNTHNHKIKEGGGGDTTSFKTSTQAGKEKSTRAFLDPPSSGQYQQLAQRGGGRGRGVKYTRPEPRVHSRTPTTTPRNDTVRTLELYVNPRSASYIHNTGQ
ncbi:hypothetical protein PoB_001002700 [Plakobranchus ocellatus]|uniref:Uncharacterized protein n=1 Tax=Plakobranchus ocellatus TaxID=259542 RepID=A0AAV3YKT3_9GAST|nr:hypothetical protein PoB_001002700 [Plakobranchus ocellatus]